MAEREISPLDDARLLGQAIANTESEIFRESADLAEPEEHEGEPDKAREDMGDGLEGQVEDEPEEGDAETDDEGEEEGEEEGKDGETEVKDKTEEKPAEPEPQVQPKGRVPVGELLTERSKRQEAEARATAIESQAQRDIAAVNARLDALLLQAQQRPTEQPRQQPQPAKPDMFADPEGYEAWLRADIASNFTQQRVNASLADAHEQHGEKFVAAYRDLTGLDPTTMTRVGPGLPANDPINRATVDRIMASPNPGRALMNWHQQQQVIREGGTPQFREKVEREARENLMKDPEFRKQMLAEMKAEASGLNGGTARVITRGTKSLNDVSGGTSAQRGDMHSIDDSDEGVFGDIWK